MRGIRCLLAALATTVEATAAVAQPRTPEPALDMHIHAYGANGEGPPSYVCAPQPTFRPLDPGRNGAGLPAYMTAMFGDPACPRRFRSVSSDGELRTRTVAELRANNVYAVAGGLPPYVDRWMADAPDRLLPAIGHNTPEWLPPDRGAPPPSSR